MGRNPKITAAEVLEIMIGEGKITTAELANLFDVHPSTIRSKLRELRNDGEAIIHDQNGLMHITKEEIENDENIAESMINFINWTLRVVQGVILCAKPTRPLYPTLRRTIKETLTTDERRQLALSCVRIKGLIDYIETEEEDQTA